MRAILNSIPELKRAWLLHRRTRLVTESSVTLPPDMEKSRDFTRPILERYRARPLFSLPNANDARTRLGGPDRLRAPAVRMPQMRPGGDAGYCIGSLQLEGGWLARWRTQGAQLRTDFREQHMLDKQNQGPQCTACGSPMRLAAIEPSMWGQDLRTFTCPQCKRVQRHVIESSVTEAWVSPKN